MSYLRSGLGADKLVAISRARLATRSSLMVRRHHRTCPRCCEPIFFSHMSIARSLLCNMTHRGAVGSDARDGDGAGVMTSIPHRFFQKEFEREQGYKLPQQGQYAT